MIEDAELLRRYAAERSEAAFAELVQRHLGLVYSVALRQVERDAHLAEDVAQKVFSDLARKAAPLSRHPVLTGWLYRSTQFTAIDVMRSERRRRAREQEAQTMHELTTGSGPAMDGEKLRPVLDQVMGELNDRDRDAVMLRFFEGRPFAEVGAKLQITEDAARMRVERTLDKMRTLLGRRGVTSTTAALAAALANQAGVAAPAGLAAMVTGAAVTGAKAGGGLGMIFMSMTKLQVGIASALVLAGATGIVMQAETNNALLGEVSELRHENQKMPALEADNLRLAKTAAEVAELRKDEGDVARLRDETALLQSRLRAMEAARMASGGETKAGLAGVTIYEISNLDRIPSVKSQARPVYPVELRKAGVAGDVLVEFIVDANGDVRDAQVLKAEPPDFAESAVTAVSQWKFQPGEKDGQPVHTRMRVPIRFTVDNNEAKRSDH